MIKKSTLVALSGWLFCLVFAGAFAVHVCACGETPPTPPIPENVDPVLGFNGAAVPVSIQGRNFLVRVFRNLGAKEEFTVDDSYQAVLRPEGSQSAENDIVLEDVVYVDTENLTATVPAGIALGTYDLQLTNPYQLSGTLTQAYRAIDWIIECVGSQECHNPTPICTSDGLCVACALDAECQALGQGFERCDLQTGSCLPCLEHGDCGAPWPYCEPGSHTCVACLEDGHCDDTNVCTDDSCADFACVYENNSLACDDGLFCNGADTCLGAVCGHAGDPCPGSECNTCNEVAGNCFDPAGTLCTDDGLYCTGVEECDGTGTCTHTGDPCPGTECNTCNEVAGNCFDPASTACTDDGNICTDDECDGNGTCLHPDNSSPCDDGLFCTATDTCSGGACSGSGDACPTQVCYEPGDYCTGINEIVDPLGDQSAFSFVFPYQGRIWMGPRTDGTGAVHMAPNGSSPGSADFSFFEDVTGNFHWNLSGGPYPSIGKTDCASDSPACGPDNEDGRGIFCSGTIGGEEWLVVAGARSLGDLDYVYMTRDNDGVLDFSYLDLSMVLGPRTRGVSAFHVFNDRLYIGFPDDGGRRPYLVLVLRTPEPPGLDADDLLNEVCNPITQDVCNLEGADMPELGVSALTSIIDSITDFNDRLYVANNGGLVRSTTNEPLDVDDHLTHWVAVTPTAASYTNHISITTDKTADLEPADKAVPAMVTFGGRLFFARNTLDGPQLWSCTPDIESGPGPATPVDCDSGDWQLVASNSSDNLTQFDNANNTHISLLQATVNYLYIAFDNPVDGIVLLRTGNPMVAARADFEGAGGCPADQHPATCQGLGGNGFGNVANSRVFSSTLLNVGPEDNLYLIVGNGTEPVKLFYFGD
jgi:hypothetical protein